MTLSLRSRLLLGALAASLAVLGASCLALYALTRRSLLSELDAYLLAKSRAVAALVEVGDEHHEQKVELAQVPEPIRAEILRRAAGGTIIEIERKVERGTVHYDVEAIAGDEKTEFKVASDESPPPRKLKIELGIGPEHFPEFQAGPGSEFLQVCRDDGELVYRSPSLQGADLPRTGRLAVLSDGRALRLAHLSFAPEHHSEARLAIAVGRQTTEIDHTLARLVSALLVVCVGAVVLSCALMGLVVRAGTRPLDRLAGRISTIGEDNLDCRLPTEALPAELLPVAQRVNDLLARLGAAFEREKAFSANVAHELRTPLAGLLSTLEVAIRRKGDPQAAERAAADSLAISRQMHAMVENLLAMARCEAGRQEVARERVPLAELLRQCWPQFDEKARDRKLAIQWEVAAPCTVTSGREKLRLILNNLLDNAVTYANSGGRIRICLGRAGERVELRIANTGCMLSEEQLGHVFERFWRADAARTEAGVHCGLGLPLCRRLVELLGGEIAVEATGGEFTARVTLPA